MDTKSILLSKTFWAIVVALAAKAFPQYIIDDVAVNDIIQVIATLFALYGRVTATKKIA